MSGAFRPVIVALAFVLVHASWARADTRRYAVVVAHTEDIAGKLAPLEYADDDGARYYELFSHIADRVFLYTVLDEPSQQIHPEVAARAGVPRKKDVLAGVERAFALARRDVERGDAVEFYFVLIGHGEVGAGGEGYVSLLDEPFTRTDLFHRVLARSPATTNHVIIDACNSYFLVHRRGGKVDDAGASHEKAIEKFLAREDLRRYPTTGVLLSTSSEKESHEWAAYGAGVFSHQLRSALAGGADANGDGRVEYSEVEAFIAAANLRVRDPRARIELFARAPAIDRARPLVSLRQARFAGWLRLPPGAGGHIYLEDARGVRFADVHPSGERAVMLGLTPSPYYYVRTGDGARELRVDPAAGSRIDVKLDRMRPSAMARRGAVAESFRLDLYAEPFGPGFYRGFIASHGGASVDLHAPAWLPGAIDASFVDAELRRLNQRAEVDRGLRRRLLELAPELRRALARGDHPGAAKLLERLEAGSEPR